MDEIILDFFENIGWAGNILLITIELICATLFSGLIGYEREYRGQSAGLRTHILVSVGACLIMNISISAPGLNLLDGSRDPARLAAQVVSGIGFLGAGTIIQNGTGVKGLTTAATLWLCGGIGLACGSGYFSGALIATIVSLIALVLLIKLEINLNHRLPRILMIVNTKNSNVLKEIMELSSIYNIDIRDIHSSLIKGKDETHSYQINLLLNKNSALNIEAFAEELKIRLQPSDFKIYNK